MYRTYFHKDTGTYLGSYSGYDESDPRHPYAGHPSVDGQVGNMFDKLVDGKLVKRAVLKSKTLEERVAVLEAIVLAK